MKTPAHPWDRRVAYLSYLVRCAIGQMRYNPEVTRRYDAILDKHRKTA